MRRFLVRHPIVEEIAYPFDFQAADNKSARAVISVRQRFPIIIGSIPGRFERIMPGGELGDSIFPMKNPYEFTFAIVDSKADCAFEWREGEAQRYRFERGNGARGER